MDDIKDKINGSGWRFNTGKVKFHLIPAEVRQHLFRMRSQFPFQQIPIPGLIALANHYDMAQNIKAKYPTDDLNGHKILANWTKGQALSGMYLASVNRHLYAYIAGEIKDNDLDVHHMIPVAWNLISFYHQISNPKYYERFDDRLWKYFRTDNPKMLQYDNESFDSTMFTEYLADLLPYLEGANDDIEGIKEFIIIGIGYALWIYYIDTFNCYDTSCFGKIDMTIDDTPKEKTDYGVPSMVSELDKTRHNLKQTGFLIDYQFTI